MERNWKESITQQREALVQILRDPLAQVTTDCIPLWSHCTKLENILLLNFPRIPYCTSLFALDTNGMQITKTVSRQGTGQGSRGCDCSQRPYLKDTVPAWGFLLSEPYLCRNLNLPLLTAIQLVRTYEHVLGYIAADFDLRNLPITCEVYDKSVAVEF